MATRFLASLLICTSLIHGGGPGTNLYSLLCKAVQTAEPDILAKAEAVLEGKAKSKGLWSQIADNSARDCRAADTDGAKDSHNAETGGFSFGF